VPTSPRRLGDVACIVRLRAPRWRHCHCLLVFDRWRHWNDVCVQFTGRDGFHVCTKRFGIVEIKLTKILLGFQPLEASSLYGRTHDEATNRNAGQYHWVSELAPPRIQKELSYTVGWLTAMGWQGNGNLCTRPSFALTMYSLSCWSLLHGRKRVAKPDSPQQSGHIYLSVLARHASHYCSDPLCQHVQHAAGRPTTND